MTDKRFLELEITEWLRSPERKKQLAGEHYYHGDQEAAHRRRLALDEDGKPIELKHLPNNCCFADLTRTEDDLNKTSWLCNALFNQGKFFSRKHWGPQGFNFTRCCS